LSGLAVGLLASTKLSGYLACLSSTTDRRWNLLDFCEWSNKFIEDLPIEDTLVTSSTQMST